MCKDRVRLACSQQSEARAYLVELGGLDRLALGLSLGLVLQHQQPAHVPRVRVALREGRANSNQIVRET